MMVLLAEVGSSGSQKEVMATGLDTFSLFCCACICSICFLHYLGQSETPALSLCSCFLSQIQDDVSCVSFLPERFTVSLKKPVYLKSEDYACSLVWNSQEGFSVSQDHTDGSLWGRLFYNLRKQISSQTVEGHAALLFMSSFAVCCDSVCHAPVLLSRRLFALSVCQNAVSSCSVVRQDVLL